MNRRKNLGLSTVFMAVLFLILAITISSILFFALHSFGYATQEALTFEEERMREKISLISLTTENISGTEYVTTLLVNNTGSITCRIRGIYIDNEFLCDPSESTNPYLNPTENKIIIIPFDTVLEVTHLHDFIFIEITQPCGLSSLDEAHTHENS